MLRLYFFLLANKEGQKSLAKQTKTHYMEYIRYHVQALMDSIINQIQGETGREVDQVRSHIGEIRQLIRTNEDELYEPDEDGSEDEDEEEGEEPIYFTTSPQVISEGVKEAIQNMQNLNAWHKRQEREDKGPVPERVPLMDKHQVPCKGCLFSISVRHTTY